MNKLILAAMAVGMMAQCGTFSDITLYGGFNKYIKR